jgi:predicted small metal-binding protein
MVIMKVIHFSIITALCDRAYGSLSSIKEDFVNMKNDLPIKAIEDIVLKQNEMIEMLSIYTDLRSTLETPYNYERIPRDSKIEVSEETIDISNDIVFVGFPASAVESIRSKWFEPLTHTDPVMASVGNDGHIVTVPGELKIRHHFHLIQISFHVADSLKLFMNQILRKDGENSYINAWELEEVMDELSSIIKDTHNLQGKITKTADDILFVLNVDIKDKKDFKYSYKNGFSNDDLKAITEEKEITVLAEKVEHSIILMVLILVFLIY